MSENKKRVMIVHNYYQIPGGEDTVVANEKKMLEEHGHEVVLYTRSNTELNNFSKRQKLLLPFSTVFNLKTYREVKKIIKDRKIQIVHVHNTLNLISPSVYYAAIHCHVPVVQTVHNFRLLCPGATFYRDGQVCEECLKKGLLCAVRHSCYRGSRLQTLACVISTKIHRMLGTYGKINYICLTEFNKEKLLHLKQIQANKVFVKPNSVSLPEKTVPQNMRKKQVVYVGRLEEIKGMNVLLGAWKYLGDDAPELYICGRGPLEEWCREYIEKNDLKKVHLTGFLPNEEVKELIGKSGALVLPTQVYEGFPMTIAEAYTCGTYVIGSDLGNTGSLIEDGISGWKFPHRSPEALAACVKKAMEWKQEFPEDIRKRYSAEENYQRLDEIYQLCALK